MNKKTSGNPADWLYAEGMKYNLRDQSPSDPTLARAAFQQAATMGHIKAIRALAHMTFDGRGGSQDREQSLLLLWSAFLGGDHDSLEELADMLESYAEAEKATTISKDAIEASRHTRELITCLSRVRHFMHEIMRQRD